VSIATTKRGGKRKKEKLEKEEDLEGIFYFSEPVLVGDLWKDGMEAEKKEGVHVFAAGHYCYAITRSQDNTQ
jgi:hypothetical protein